MVVELDMVPPREAIQIPIEVYLTVMKETALAEPELFLPLREGTYGDSIAKFLDGLMKHAHGMSGWRVETQ